MAAMAPECPPGYRLLQPRDVAVGKKVLYISRDPSSSHIHTQIIDTTIKNDTTSKQWVFILLRPEILFIFRYSKLISSFVDSLCACSLALGSQVSVRFAPTGIPPPYHGAAGAQRC